jgi:hypothetical protein
VRKTIDGLNYSKYKLACVVKDLAGLQQARVLWPAGQDMCLSAALCIGGGTTYVVASMY